MWLNKHQIEQLTDLFKDYDKLMTMVKYLKNEIENYEKDKDCTGFPIALEEAKKLLNELEGEK